MKTFFWLGFVRQGRCKVVLSNCVIKNEAMREAESCYRMLSLIRSLLLKAKCPDPSGNSCYTLIISP